MPRHGKPRVSFILRGLPAYRAPLYEELARRQILDFTVYYQRHSLPAAVLGYVEAPDPDRPFLRSFPAFPAGAGRWLRPGSLPNPGLLGAALAGPPDAVVLEGLSNAAADLAAYPYLRWKGIPFVWWGLGKTPCRKATFRSRAGDTLQRWFLGGAAASLAYSVHGREHHLSLGADPATALVVYNTLDERKIVGWAAERATEGRDLRERLLGGDQGDVLLFCGTINRGKRLDDLLRAFSAQPDDPSRRTVLAVVGDGADAERCRALAGELGIRDRVIWAGRRDGAEASPWFLASDLVVMPGLGGLAINHAFAHGRPVLCGPADGCERDLVVNGRTGWLMSEGSEAELERTLGEALSRRDEWGAMGRNAFDRISREITLSRFAATVELAVFLATGRAPHPDTLRDAHEVPPVAGGSDCP